MLIAFQPGSVLLSTGQTSTQSVQPVQSSGATWIASSLFGRSFARHDFVRKPLGAASTSSGAEDLHA